MRMKTRGITRYVMVGVAFLLAAAFFLPSSAMAPPPLERGPIPEKELKEIKKAPVTVPIDLRVVGILSEGSCRSPDLDCPSNAFYFEDIIVGVGNYPPEPGAGGVSVNVPLRVSWTEASGRSRWADRTVRNLPCPGSKNVTIVTGPICVLKSHGIKAEIRMPSRGSAIKDVRPDNNVFTVYDCYSFAP
jgi:hypothetical protein